ncbi:SDR family NAD(P)-dependent oxidoreductase [Glaciimonas soli]|uniref:SDR family oxidoreductase n=1 Tax=Glaciimonas soli TaxID=2590999 RepID=A0A843YS55_9BURK|nr:SDR family NAD(P)-dependent oxidoreductase [Glaciimonas soli]MQR02569.1 SDR family oxidoreductase [Glaciimonas soli]
MNLNFSGKTVAISGVSSGFGVAITKRFLSLGANVFGCDVSDTAFSDLERLGAVLARVDLTNSSSASAWIEDVENSSSGVVDVLINNAGGVAGQTKKPIEQLTDEEWRVVIDINLGSTFSLCRAVVPGMKRTRSGTIVNISSGAALQASMTGIQAYCAAKHAVLGLTRQLAHELGPFGIRANTVAPGFIVTNEATQKQWDAYGQEKQKVLLEQIALRRLGTADEIADAVLFFASNLSTFINGQVLSIDGGK